MISLIYPIKNRLNLFANTIDSILNYCQGIRGLFEIIVLDSGSEDHIWTYCYNIKKFLNIKYVLYDHPKAKNIHNPAYAINLGVKLAKYDSIAISCPEVKHKTNVIEQLLKLIGNNVICRCIDTDENDNEIKDIYNSKRNHPGLYFLAMYNKKDFLSIGGIDETLMDGYAFDDTDFGVRFKKAKIPFISRNDIITVHQWHIRGNKNMIEYKINKKIYENNLLNNIIVVNKNMTIGNRKYIVREK